MRGVVCWPRPVVSERENCLLLCGPSACPHCVQLCLVPLSPVCVPPRFLGRSPTRVVCAQGYWRGLRAVRARCAIPESPPVLHVGCRSRSQTAFSGLRVFCIYIPLSPTRPRAWRAQHRTSSNGIKARKPPLLYLTASHSRYLKDVENKKRRLGRGGRNQARPHGVGETLTLAEDCVNWYVPAHQFEDLRGDEALRVCWSS